MSALPTPARHYLDRLSRLGVRNMVRIAGRITEDSGIPRALILADMARASVRYYAGYYDYHEWDFHLLDHAERSTFLTRPQGHQLVVRYNDRDYAPFFEDKLRFNTRFRDYVGRAWLDLRETDVAGLRAFLRDRPRTFAKDPVNLGGYGLETIHRDREDPAACWSGCARAARCCSRSTCPSTPTSTRSTRWRWPAAVRGTSSATTRAASSRRASGSSCCSTPGRPSSSCRRWRAGARTSPSARRW